MYIRQLGMLPISDCAAESGAVC